MDTPEVISVIVIPVVFGVVGYAVSKMPKRTQKILTILGAVVFTSLFVIALLVYRVQSADTT